MKNVFFIQMFYLVTFSMGIYTSLYCLSQQVSPVPIPECAFILQHLKKYTRQVTVLIVGDSRNELSCDIVNTCDAVVVMINPHDPETLVNECVEKQQQNVIVIPKILSLSELTMLGECEHFDVVIVKSLQEYRDGWYLAFRALLNAGDYHFIFLPKSLPSKYQEFIDTFLQKKITFKHKYQGNNADVFCIYHKKMFLRRKWWGSLRLQPAKRYEIISDFNKKMLRKKTVKYGYQTSNWVHGINLTTFYMLGGIYPLKEDIVTELRSLAKIQHRDNTMTNIIIQGRSLKLIDFTKKGDKRSNKIKNVMAAFSGEKIAFNDPKEGKIQYKDAINKKRQNKRSLREMHIF